MSNVEVTDRDRRLGPGSHLGIGSPVGSFGQTVSGLCSVYRFVGTKIAAETQSDL